MLPYLRRRYPDAHIAMLLNRYAGEVVDGNPCLDELIWYDNEAHRPLSFGAMRSVIRGRTFDAAVVVHPTPRLAWLMRRSGIPVRIGSGYRYYSLLFNRRLWEHRKDAKHHELEYNLHLLQKLDCPIPPFPVDPVYGIRVQDDARARLKAIMDGRNIPQTDALVVVHPASGGSAREWPPEHFGRLARRLVSDQSVRVVVTGVAGDAPVVKTVVDAGGEKVHSLAGALGLTELAALLKSAALAVSNSTGPLHLAVAVGTPVVGLYPQITAMSARRWGPYGGENRVLAPERSHECSECSGRRGDRCRCMESIGVDKVFDACAELLSHAHLKQKGALAHEL